MTRPDGPTRGAASRASNPAPEPRSRTVSPGCRAARAVGFPQPKPMLAPSGTEPIVRVMVQHENQREAETLAKQLADRIAELG